MAEIGLDSALQNGEIPIVSDAALRTVCRSFSDYTVICWSHSTSNLLTKVFRDSIENFLPGGKKLHQDVQDLVSKANQPLEKKLRPNGVKNLNEFLNTLELDQEQIMDKLKVIHRNFNELNQEKQNELMKKITKLEKLVRCPETRFR